MNFWKNERYNHFEKNTREGDPLRGQAFQNFPWNLATGNATDSQNDSWELSITCTNVTPAKMGPEVVVTLEAFARCTLSDARLKELGFSPNRLQWMGLDPHEIVSERVSAQIKIKLDQIELVAKGNLKKFEAYILKTYTALKKAEMIRNRIDNSKFSRFDMSSNGTTPTRE